MRESTLTRRRIYDFLNTLSRNHCYKLPVRKLYFCRPVHDFYTEGDLSDSEVRR